MLWRPAEGAGRVVVHFHGNGEQIASTAWLGEELARRGVSFAAVEYPGYPGAAGVPSEEGIVAAAEKAVQHLTTTMGISPDRVVLSGQSLGTGVVVVLASRGWGTRTALLSPYTSLPAVAARGALRLFPVRLLMHDRFDSAALAPGIRQPVLVLHGDRDEVVPFELGQALVERFPRAHLVRVQGAGHNDLWEHSPTASEYFAFVSQ
jgi:pimeloyl-ACP methyl ester carboxylesterase